MIGWGKTPSHLISAQHPLAAITVKHNICCLHHPPASAFLQPPCLHSVVSLVHMIFIAPRRRRRNELDIHCCCPGKQQTLLPPSEPWSTLEKRPGQATLLKSAVEIIWLMNSLCILCRNIQEIGRDAPTISYIHSWISQRISIFELVVIFPDCSSRLKASLYRYIIITCHLVVINIQTTLGTLQNALCFVCFKLRNQNLHLFWVIATMLYFPVWTCVPQGRTTHPEEWNPAAIIGDLGPPTHIIYVGRVCKYSPHT